MAEAAAAVADARRSRCRSSPTNRRAQKAPTRSPLPPGVARAGTPGTRRISSSSPTPAAVRRAYWSPSACSSTAEHGIAVVDQYESVSLECDYRRNMDSDDDRDSDQYGPHNPKKTLTFGSGDGNMSA